MAVLSMISIATSCVGGAADAPPNPTQIKLPFAFSGLHAESTPVVFSGRALLVENFRDWDAKKQDASYLYITDLATGNEVARFGVGFSFVSAFVEGEQMNVFATKNTNGHWTQDIYRLWSSDLKTWNQKLAVAREGDEHFFNTSVCRDEQGYVMAYESNKPYQWCFRFARSKDLATWEKIPDLEFSDAKEPSVLANPTIRYFSPYYYVVLGTHRGNGPAQHYQYALAETKYVTLVARSKDLEHWEFSPTRNPMLDPIPGEGVNNTDADLFEFEGNTYLYYMTGDQQTWATIRVAMHAGPMKQMLEAYFPAGAQTIQFDARKRQFIYPKSTR